MQDNNLRIAFDYKYPDVPVLMVYEVQELSIFIRKTIVGDEAVKLYSQLTGKSIPDIHMEAGNINWGAFDVALAKRLCQNGYFITPFEVKEENND